MLVKTNNKWDAVKALHNTLIKDPTFYCNNCNDDYRPNHKDVNGKWIPCCDTPHIGRHLDHCKAVIDQNKERRKENLNEFGSTDKKTIRNCISMPPRFYHTLVEAFRNTYGHDLFDQSSKVKLKKDLHGFMRAFPYYCACDRV